VVSAIIWFARPALDESEPIILTVGKEVCTAFDNVRITSIEKRNGETFICVTSTNGTIYETNNGGTTELRKESGYCEPAALFKTRIKR
jgi:hypothetical protein